MKRPRVDVNLEELDQIIERGTLAPLSEVGKRKAQERAARAGRDAGEATHDRKDQERFGTAGDASARK